MCGIFGAIGWEQFNSEGVYSSLKERGPDSHGIWSNTKNGICCSLFHTRLAIQDGTHLGHQPMVSENKDLVIVFNGEIYNKTELRNGLQVNGYQFNSNSDTEVLLKGFEHWKDKLWGKLNGIFAIACWEISSQTLTLVRDRFGVKPLLLYQTGNKCAFSSELSALLASEVMKDTRVNSSSIESYSLWGAVASPNTILEQVNMIEAGKITKRHSNGDWLIDDFVESQNEPTLDDKSWNLSNAVNAIENRLIETVKQQSIGDYPIGIFLSGGIDSGLIASVLNEVQEENIKSVSIGFKGLSGVKDELKLAEKTAKAIGIDHISIKVSSRDLDENFDLFLNSIDQPSIDGFNSFLVAKAARSEGMRVCFSGLGADEVFGGYSHMQNNSLYSANKKRILKFNGLSNSLRNYHAQQRLTKLDLKTQTNIEPTMHAISKLELCGYLQDTLLRDSDAVTMAQGLELRVPFLDQQLVSLARSIPSSIHNEIGPKSILVKIAKQRLPAEIVNSPKQGFNLALADWIVNNTRFSPDRIYSLIIKGLRAQDVRISKRSFYASWLLLKFSHRWSPYWRWIVLGEWLALHSESLNI